MDDHPPGPPDLRPEDVAAIVRWLDAYREWVRADAAVAARHGHRMSPDVLRQVQLYEDTALLFRETYGVGPA